ncbi:spermatogenesis-defective protein 39 homolog [Rhopilema esculentum]|uniref:spermatogenesis-defective protein 39 homolog n=1 Tax=Rhopilema esculentum TaxID=499914 RepID=UPI0031CE6E8A
MAGGRVTFSGLMDADGDLSEEDLLEMALQEDAEFSRTQSSKREAKPNLFDWNQDDEERESHNMKSLSNKLFEIDPTDLCDAREFLKKSKFDPSDGKASDEIVGEAWGGEKYSLKGKALQIDKAQPKQMASVASSARVRSGSSGATNSGSFSSKASSTRPSITKDVRGATAAVDKSKISAGSWSSEQVKDLNDVISNEPQISAKEYDKVKQELRQCKSMIESMKSDRWKSVSPQETVKRLILSKPYSLEFYKSLPEKVELLDYALKYHDGNAITAIVLFLKRTLRPDLFAKQLKRKPEALNHFIRYLEATGEWRTLMDLYKQLYKNEDAAMLYYHYITKLEDPGAKLQEIEKWQRDNRNIQGLAEIQACVEEERKVIELQMKIEKEDQDAEKSGKNVMLRYHPRAATVLLQPLSTTLYYCAMYHFEKPTDEFHPTAVKKNFKLTDKQYEWSVLPARAKFHKWTDVSEILTTTGWLRKRSEKSVIGFDKVTEILRKNAAPGEIIEKYVRLIDNPESRLKMASACKCHDVAIDTIIVMKDKQKLEQYAENVKFDEKYRRRIYNLLNDGSIKWR